VLGRKEGGTKIDSQMHGESFLPGPNKVRIVRSTYFLYRVYALGMSIYCTVIANVSMTTKRVVGSGKVAARSSAGATCAYSKASIGPRSC
jgi:hypothetical protein